MYNNIIVSNDSNEEDALLNSAVESSGNHPDSNDGHGHGHGSNSGNSTKGGQLKHEAASGGPSSGSKDIVLSTNGSRTKIIVRKAKGSAKRSALDSYRKTQSKQDSCSCSKNSSPSHEKEVIPVFVPFCGDPMQDAAASYAPQQLGMDGSEESRRLEYFLRQPFFVDPLIMAGISPAFPFSPAQFAAARSNLNLRMRPFRSPSRISRTSKSEAGYLEEGESRHSGKVRPVSSEPGVQVSPSSSKDALEDEHRRMLQELHYRHALGLM